MSIVEVLDLSVSRGDRVLADGLAFSVSAGEALHVQGPNGVGKTSLLEIVAGLRAPRQGRVVRAAPGLHWLGAGNALNANLSPLENLAFWCALNDVRGDGRRDALARMGVDRLRHRPCRTLSTGQRRRVAIARLLLDVRPLWVLDEPLSGLDVDGVALFGSLLATHLVGQGAAIATSHQPLDVGGAPLRVLALGAAR